MTDDIFPAASPARKVIVIVDDEATQRLLTRDSLEQEGYRVEEASNGEDGLSLIRRLKPDLVMLDVMMPGIDGFEVCRRIRGESAICRIPVIIVTGKEDTADIRKGFDAGATDFLTKPVTWNLLPNRISFVLRTSGLEHELRVAKEDAEKASEAKSVLLSTMGHELRTPLNAIIGFSELMRQEALGPIQPPQYAEFIADIYTSGKRLLEAINAILEIVRCESEIAEADQDDISAVDLMEGIIQRIAPEAIASGIQVLSDIPDDTVCFRGNEHHLHKALYKLTSNAVKYTEAGGLVRLRMTVSERDGLVFAVVDNGIGISPNDLPRIMEPFEQADSSLSRNFEGLGLGIPLARTLARLHGGDVFYESELGKGTTARLALPYKRVIVSGEKRTRRRSA